MQYVFIHEKSVDIVLPGKLPINISRKTWDKIPQENKDKLIKGVPLDHHCKVEYKKS